MPCPYPRVTIALGCLAVASLTVWAADDPVFRSEVAMSRVDARVMDRDGRMVTGLGPKDFVLKLDGKELPVGTSPTRARRLIFFCCLM